MILWLIFACAIKDGSEVLRIQKAYQEHVQDKSSTDLSFEQAMAKLYMQKSWEEYTNSQYQDALNLAVKCEEWLLKSKTTKEKTSVPLNTDDAPIAQPTEEKTEPSKTDDEQDTTQDSSK